MITETSTTSAWTFDATGAPAALNLIAQASGASAFSVNYSAMDDHNNVIPATTVTGYLEDQTQGATYGGYSIRLNFQGVGFPNGGSSTVHFSEKQNAIYADCSSATAAAPMALGTASCPFASLVLSRTPQGTDTYVIFVDTDGALKAKNPSGVLTTLATP